MRYFNPDAVVVIVFGASASMAPAPLGGVGMGTSLASSACKPTTPNSATKLKHITIVALCVFILWLPFQRTSPCLQDRILPFRAAPESQSPRIDGAIF